MRYNKYFFENFSMEVPFDVNDPRYVLSLDGVDPVLERVINSSPYSLSIDDFEEVELIRALLHIDVLQERNDRLGMGVPFFAEKDSEILKEFCISAADGIAGELLANKDRISELARKIENGYPLERNLYHILCGYIFDGLMFDYLEQNELVTTSCIHDSGSDYLVIIYEDARSLNEYSDLMLCSYNRLTRNGKGFVSFGDSNGSRKDFYRFFRQKELSKLREEEHAYTNFSAEQLIDGFEKLVKGIGVAPVLLEVFEYFGYCKNGKIDVPVFDSKSYDVAKELYEFVLSLTKEKLSAALELIQNEHRLLAVAHGVPPKDIANEIYHLIFGEVNELLVKGGLVQNPPHIKGEGRYFKSFEC